MAIFTAFDSGIGIDMTSGAQFVFVSQGNGVNDDMNYSWFTDDGSDARALGSGISFLAGQPLSGTISRIDFFLDGGRADGMRDVRLSGINADLVDVTSSTTEFYELFDGDHTISGSGFDDILEGGAGNDVLNAFDGDDTIRGGFGNDDIAGFGGNDYADGGSGDDSVQGSGGDDTLRGGTGVDVISGGSGSDLLLIDVSEGSFDGDRYIGGLGMSNEVDTLLFEGVGVYDFTGTFLQSLEAIDFGADSGGADTEVIFNADEVAEGFFGVADILSDAGSTTVEAITIEMNDDLIFDISRWTFDGWGVEDVITVLGDRDDEEIIGSSVADTLDGGVGNDELTGGGGGDLLIGRDGNDTIEGDAGDDRVEAGRGDDTIAGGTGNDTIFGGNGDDGINGDGGDDVIRGGGARDIIEGGSGEDTIYGDSSHDDLFGNGEDDALFGGFGRDLVNGGTGDDLVRGGFGNDTVIGSLGDDRVFGGGGNDSLMGGDGDDVLNGGTERDFMTGGAGVDRFVFSADWGFDTVTDFANDGLEKLDLRNLAGTVNFATDLALTNGTGGALVRHLPSGDRFIVEGVAAADLDAGDFLL